MNEENNHEFPQNKMVIVLTPAFRCMHISDSRSLRDSNKLNCSHQLAFVWQRRRWSQSLFLNIMRSFHNPICLASPLSRDAESVSMCGNLTCSASSYYRVGWSGLCLLYLIWPQRICFGIFWSVIWQTWPTRWDW